MRTIKNSKISNETLRKIILLFIGGESALKASVILKVNRHTVERIYLLIRKALFENAERFNDAFFPHLKNKNHVNPKGRAPLIGISSFIFMGKFNSSIYLISANIIDFLSDRKMARIEKFGKFDYKDIAIKYGCDAVCLGNFKKFYISEKISINNESRIKRFINFSAKTYSKYFGINREYYKYYLKELEWKCERKSRSKHLGSPINPLDDLMIILKKYLKMK